MAIGGNTFAERREREVRYVAQGDNPYGFNLARMDSHGGWIATPTALVQFAMRVDGYASVPDILKRETVAAMVTAPKASPGYARGWAVNPRHRNRWHDGLLPGSASILVRVDGDVCFAGLVNTRSRGTTPIGDALDALMWKIHDEAIG